MKIAWFFGALLISASMDCFSVSLVDRDIKEILEESRLVIEGRVIRIEAECVGGGCFSEVTVAIERAYKGVEVERGEVAFCSSAPLAIGVSYVFFVESDEGKSQKMRCNSVVERDAVFSRFGKSVYRYMSPGSFDGIKIRDVDYLTGWIVEKDFDFLIRN